MSRLTDPREAPTRTWYQLEPIAEWDDATDWYYRDGELDEWGEPKRDVIVYDVFYDSATDEWAVQELDTVGICPMIDTLSGQQVRAESAEATKAIVEELLLRKRAGLP